MTCRWPWPRRAPCWPAPTCPVPEYLRQLEQQPTLALSEDSPLREYSEAVEKAWNLSLDHLKGQSAAAARLLEICAVMAPGHQPRPDQQPGHGR